MLTKINNLVDALPDIIEEGISKLAVVHAVPTSVEELDELISFHNLHFDSPHISLVSEKDSIRLMIKAPHYLNGAEFYI